MRLLLADDHDLVREALELLLYRSDPSIEVVHARSLHEALGKAAEPGRIDFILLDVRMPGMNRWLAVMCGARSAMPSSTL